MKEGSTVTRKIQHFTVKYASKLNRRIQNRQSSAKLRNNNKTQLDELSERVKQIAQENNTLKLENNELRETNAYLVKKVGFYERTLKASLQQNEEAYESDEIRIICGPSDDKYVRINGTGDKQKFVRNFLCLTILTVFLQLIDVNVGGGEVSSGSNQLRLKSIDIGAVSHNFITRMVNALPTTLFFAKNVFLIVWVVVLVLNYKRIVK